MKITYLKKIIFLIFSLTILKNSYAQDMHFSQFYVNPVSINPAAAGVILTDYRLVNNYRDQWRSIGSPYKTIASSFDMHLLKNKMTTGFLGSGLSFYRDRAGSSNMGQMQINGCVSYTSKLSKKHFLSGGAQVGWIQRSATFGGLKWDNQFNGSYHDPSLSSGESSGGSSYSYFDYTGGILWNYFKDNYLKIHTGLSVAHITRPNNSFVFAEGLYRKYIVHGGAHIGFRNTNKTLLPYYMIAFQGRSMEVNAGAMFKYVLGMDSKYTQENISSAIYFGCFYRFGDAVVPTVRFDYHKNLSFALSYDVNISGLIPATYGRGGFEISVQYYGFVKKINKVTNIDFN